MNEHEGAFFPQYQYSERTLVLLKDLPSARTACQQPFREYLPACSTCFAQISSFFTHHNPTISSSPLSCSDRDPRPGRCPCGINAEDRHAPGLSLLGIPYSRFNLQGPDLPSLCRRYRFSFSFNHIHKPCMPFVIGQIHRAAARRAPRVLSEMKWSWRDWTT